MSCWARKAQDFSDGSRPLNGLLRDAVARRPGSSNSAQDRPRPRWLRL